MVLESGVVAEGRKFERLSKDNTLQNAKIRSLFKKVAWNPIVPIRHNRNPNSNK